MRFLCRLVISVLPILLAVLGVFLKPHWNLVESIVLCCFVFLAWRLLSAWQGVAGPRLGSPLGLLLGVGLGAILTVCSVIAMGVVGGYPFEFHSSSTNDLPLELTINTRTACIEETFMRGGMVHFLASFFGPGWGYLGGSVPFALLHFLSGQFTFGRLVCISSAGLMLSAAYLEYGLLAAIGVHFAWNFVSRFLIATLHWQQFGSTFALESAWTTTFILLTATGAMVMLSRRRKPDRQPVAPSDAGGANDTGNAGPAEQSTEPPTLKP